MFGIKIMGYADGRRSEYNDVWLASYRPPPEKNGFRGPGEIRVTCLSHRILRFPSARSAFEFWQQEHGLRPDGKANKPLTAFTVEISEC